MRVLVACECSGQVRRAMRKRGHDAWSCDLKPAEDGGEHIQGDVLSVLGDRWDIMIAHPDCTFLTVANTYKGRGCAKYTAAQAVEYTEQAVRFFMRMAEAPIPKIAIENPIGIMSSRYRKPDQIIQPWQFGDDASKATCLWLKGLPTLTPTRTIPPSGWKTVKFLADLFDADTDEAWCDDCSADFADCSCPGPTMDEMEYATVCGVMFARPKGGEGKPVWANQTPSGQNKLGPSPTRTAERARTYPGIAEAMADQWGGWTHD